ncbi:MAG: P-loop NTPase [Isosphaeraceae bacterium]|nr:P-loop NTPase [Isosphaeraceae bacterium]
MSDQADGLRQLIRSREGPMALADPPPRARLDEPEAPAGSRSLVLTSGKGGVGTSNLALNLAIALGEYGQRVVLIDADLGLANIDLLCGLAPRCDLGDVLAGACPLAEAIVTGPGDCRIVPGAHGMRTLLEALEDGPERLAMELAELESTTDFLLIDAGSGLGPGVPTLAAAADGLVAVTTPEPTSVADAHAALGRFRRPAGIGTPSLRAVVNQAASAAEAADCLARLCAGSRQFHGLVVSPLGYVRSDPHLPLAVRRRQPFITEFPGSAAAKDVRRLARALLEERRPRPPRPGFFAALAARFALGRAAR